MNMYTFFNIPSFFEGGFYVIFSAKKLELYKVKEETDNDKFIEFVAGLRADFFI
jgi:hypothetical protein